MKRLRLIILTLLLGALPTMAQAQAGASSTNPVAGLNLPAKANPGSSYHLDTSFGYRHPLNGDYDWILPATVSFGKMLDDCNSLDGVFGGGVVELKPGSPADAQAHQPFFLELGVAWRHYFADRKATWKPYLTAGASVLWMTWEYRQSVDSPHFGDITRDFLEGADGYAGVGLSVRLQKRLNCFGEVDAGGVGYLSKTYSGEHNNLFQNYGYVTFRGGLSWTF